jgi:hypothetical protein
MSSTLRAFAPDARRAVCWLAALAVLLAACGRDSHAATHENADLSQAQPPRPGCGHAACGNNFYIDVASREGCSVGAACGVVLTLVATGDYHINDEYPYKFQADEASGVEFLGTDVAGKSIFSKNAHNWTKNDEKMGTMTVTCKPTSPGDKTVGGVFKLSVCSAQNCQLERETVTATLAVR